MSTQAAGDAIRTSIVVDAPIERAFAVFTEDFGSFKPREHNMLGVDIAETVFEPRVGGHSTTAASTAASAAGRACSPTSRPTASSSAGTSARTGSSRPTSRRRARSRCASSPRRRSARASSSSTATSTATATAGRPCATGVDSEDGWPLYLERYADLLRN